MFSYSYEPYNITSYIFLYIIYVVYIYVIHGILIYYCAYIYSNILNTTFYEYYVPDTMIHIKILFGEEQEYYIRICII